MNGLMLDHLQGLVVILHCNMMSKDVSVEPLKAEEDWEAFLLDVCISGLHISGCIADKGDGPSILD